MNLQTRNRIFNDAENLVLQCALRFNDWIIRRSMENNKEKFKAQLKESLGYMPKDDEIAKYGELRTKKNGEVWFFYKAQYRFEWKV